MAKTNGGFGSGGETCTVVEMERITDVTVVRGSYMTFHDVDYRIRGKKRRGCCAGVEEKTILASASGVIEPGINAIMGSTGSGKTSLLDVLAGRKDSKWLSGNVLLGGKPLPKNFRYLSGYVVQDNLLIGTITVREALWFCANMRLSSSMLRCEKSERIKKVLSDLELVSCADNKIGTNLIRGISGNEKKRTSIALEMILNPRILFLDEPTTGLDASTAISVIGILKKLGQEGRTIVCSIHQPRCSIFELFDSLTLLSEGEVVYHGAANQVVVYFESIGYHCPTKENPANFVLDVLNGRYGDKIDNGGVGQHCPRLVEKLRRKYRGSDQYRRVEELKKGGVIQDESEATAGKMYATGILHQLWVLLRRTLINMVRNPAALLSNVFMNIIIGLVFGFLYFQVSDTGGSGVQNRSGILFFICTSLLFGSISVINAFTAERDIFIHEYISGYYRVLSYFLAKVLADLIPLRTIAPIFFGAITYWMVGLKPEVSAFFIFLLTCILIGYASVGIGLFYSASFQQPVAQVLLVLTYVFTIIFSGLFVNVEKMLPWISWLQYLSIARYGLVGLSINEFRGRIFVSYQNSTSPPSSVIAMANSSAVTPCEYIKGEDYLHDELSVGSGPNDINNWDLWMNNVALACICIVLYALTYVQLLRIKKYS